MLCQSGGPSCAICARSAVRDGPAHLSQPDTAESLIPFRGGLRGSKRNHALRMAIPGDSTGRANRRAVKIKYHRCAVLGLS